MNLLTSHQQKALNFQNHISLTANAGSGKTFVLSRRYIEIALSENGLLKRIAAITFTDKAAGELYKKIAEQVEKRFEKSDNPEEKTLLNKIRRQLVSANIATIHSFCIDILKQFPVEAGIDANFQPIDEITSNELIDLSVDEVIKEALYTNTDSEPVKYLVRFFGSKLTLGRQLNKFIKERGKVLLLQDEIYNQSDDKIAEKFYNDYSITMDRILETNKNEFIAALGTINETILYEKSDNPKALEVKFLLKNLLEEKLIEKKIEIINSIKSQAFVQKGNVREQGYLKKGLRDGLINEISVAKNYINDLPLLSIPANHIKIEKELARFGKVIISLFTDILARYELKKKENGYLDYEDILLLTKNILTNPGVRSNLSGKFKYIMVDEYQDTNEIQYKIFLPILDYLRKGNLFVVGDEKQSIYMFRDAELEVFRITKKNISDASGENFLLSLPDSFRMAPGISLFVNKLFRNLFSHPNELFNEVIHTDLVCAKREETDSLVEILIGNSENGQQEENNSGLSEAELVAGRIISLINGVGISRKLNWREIAILVRKRKSFASLEKIFIEKNIPFNIVGGKGFYQRQSVYDIYNYFSFLLDNKNDTSLTGILRSPFFNLSDSLIYCISLNKGKTLWEKLILQSNENISLQKTVELLKNNIELVMTYTPPQLLRKILSESSYLTVLAQKAAGDQETANIEKLIKLTINFQAKGFKTLYDYVNFLKESIEQTEDEAQAAIADESDSVKVMTLHQAKGLEYPAVFLFNAHESVSADKVKKGAVFIDKNFGLLTKVPLNDYFGEPYSAPINAVSDFISSKKEIAELKRLLYVGATRAKNYLFISAPEEKNYKDNSFMQLILKGLDVDLSKEEYLLEDSLNFLKIENEKYINNVELLREKIKIRRRLHDIPFEIKPEVAADYKKELMISEVKDVPRGEIITATKFATFTQCHLKFKLIYEYGISNLVSGYRNFMFKKWNEKKNKYDFNPLENINNENENDTKYYVPSELRGSIFHKILQKYNSQVHPEEIKKELLQGAPRLSEYENKALQDDIINNLNRLFESPVYNKIKEYNKFYNEYEVYLNEKDYFLHGIIDKLIIDKDRAIIVDYKTNDLQKKEICELAKVYFPQLKFYSYIISRLFKGLTTFELRLIFIKFPGEEIVEVIDKNGASQFGNEIDKMIDRLRTGEFSQNLSHCKNCSMALNNKCIIDWA